MGHCRFPIYRGRSAYSNSEQPTTKFRALNIGMERPRRYNLRKQDVRRKTQEESSND